MLLQSIHVPGLEGVQIQHYGFLQVIGCHMVGDDAPEIMQGIAIAMKCNATKAQFDSTVGIHPTAAEELVTMRQRVRRIQGQGTGRGHEHGRMVG